jgi:hypothetical protein
MPQAPMHRPAVSRFDVAPQVQRAAHDRLEQQHGKKKVVNQALDLVPHAAVERGVAAQEPADGDEGEIGEEQAGAYSTASRIIAGVRLMSPVHRSRKPAPELLAFRGFVFSTSPSHQGVIHATPSLARPGASAPCWPLPPAPRFAQAYPNKPVKLSRAVRAGRHDGHHRARDLRAAGQGARTERSSSINKCRWRRRHRGRGRDLARHARRLRSWAWPRCRPPRPTRRSIPKIAVQPHQRLHAHHQHRRDAQHHRGASELSGQGLRRASWPS